jgi:hypothetical protein
VALGLGVALGVGAGAAAAVVPAAATVSAAQIAPAVTHVGIRTFRACRRIIETSPFSAVQDRTRRRHKAALGCSAGRIGDLSAASAARGPGTSAAA